MFGFSCLERAILDKQRLTYLPVLLHMRERRHADWVRFPELLLPSEPLTDKYSLYIFKLSHIPGRCPVSEVLWCKHEDPSSIPRVT